MILSSAPNIDKRAAADVAQELQTLLRLYAPAWNEVDPNTGQARGMSSALVGVAARFAEIIIQRLNQVPQKNFLAFLELLGAALLPPQPARVPLTFSLAQGSMVDGLVPAGTQVAAPPAPGEKDPVIYETENELVVTAARLSSVMVRDPDEDQYADYSNELLLAGSTGTPIFHGNYKIEHILYLGDNQLLSLPGITSLSLVFNLAAVTGPRSVQWEVWDGKRWTAITATSSNAQINNLLQPGTIQFGAMPLATNTTALPRTSVNGLLLQWVRARLLTPITLDVAAHDGMVNAAQLPKVTSVSMQVHVDRSDLPLDTAFFNQLPIDLSKDFFPFGEKPRFNDTFWLSLEEAFSNPGASIRLNVTLTEQVPISDKPPVLSWEALVGKSWVQLGTSDTKGSKPGQAPDFKDTTRAFTVSGAVSFTTKISPITVNGIEKHWVRVRIIGGHYGTEATYKKVDQAKVVPPGAAVPAATTTATPVAFEFQPATFNPPSIAALRLSYTLDKSAPPARIFTYNDLHFKDVTNSNNVAGKSFAPFKPTQDLRPTVYFGFVLPPERKAFPNSTINLFFRATDLHYGQKTVPVAPDISRGAGDPLSVVTHQFFVTNPGATAATYNFNIIGTQWKLPDNSSATSVSVVAPITVQPGESKEVDVLVTVPAGTAFGSSDRGFLQLIAADQTIHSAEFITFSHQEPPNTKQLRLTWEYWNGRNWAGLAVNDATSNLTTAGVVEFLAPPDFTSHLEFDTSAYWLRVRWEEGNYNTDPRINRVLVNTTMAAQTITLRSEVLGSSDGSAGQTFKTTRTPVLAGPQVQVREPEVPSGDELDALVEEEGENAITGVLDAGGRPVEIWVRWHEVQDFYGSGPRSRHYTLDHLTGQISFGNGLSGLIPPVGSGNLRVAVYKTGGGVRGNRAAGSIVQLKTTLPYIDKATNYDPASGGAEAESLDSMISRAPTEIRHRHRSVTKEDFGDLAHLASPDVARALCVPNRDLVADPFDKLPITPGTVSLIIVPKTTDPKPQPSMELVRRVQAFISSSSPATATVLVVGPLYLRVDVQMEIGLASLEGSGTLIPQIQAALAAFLHPLAGGFAGQGWEFGREPHRSDLYTVIKQVKGVDHVRSLVVQSTEDFPGSRQTGRFLVYSGIHAIKLVFEPA